MDKQKTSEQERVSLIYLSDCKIEQPLAGRSKIVKSKLTIELTFLGNNTELWKFQTVIDAIKATVSSQSPHA